MNQTDSKLYELLGDKTLSSECSNAKRSQEPTIADLHRWMNAHVNTERIDWVQSLSSITAIDYGLEILSGGIQSDIIFDIDYDSSISLIDQSEETKLAIISLITSHS